MVLDAVSNFVRGNTDAAIASGDTTISVADASIFPDPATDGEFNVVIWDVNNFPRPDQDANVEIVRVTARDTGANELTVTRAQEMTSAAAHPDGSAIHLSPTAKMFSDIESTFADFWDADAQQLTGDVNNTNTTTETLEADGVFSAEPDVNYGSPLWFGQTDAYIRSSTLESLERVFQSTSGSASINLSVSRLELDTGDTAESEARIADRIDTNRATWDKSKSARFECSARDENGTKAAVIGSYTQSTPESEHIGCVIIGNEVFATAADGTSQTTSKITEFSGVFSPSIKLDYNGSELTVSIGGDSTTISNNLPSGDGLSSAMRFTATTFSDVENEGSLVFIREAIWTQAP